MFLCWPPTRVRVVVSDFERSTSCRRERAGSGRLHRLSYCQSRYTKASYVSAGSERLETTPSHVGRARAPDDIPSSSSWQQFYLTLSFQWTVSSQDWNICSTFSLLLVRLVLRPPMVWMYISWWMRRLEGVFHDALRLCRTASSKLQPRATISMHLNWIDI